MMPYWRYRVLSPELPTQPVTTKHSTILWTKIACSLFLFVHVGTVIAPFLLSYTTLEDYSRPLSVIYGCFVATIVSLDFLLFWKVVNLDGHHSALLNSLAILSALLSSTWLLVYHLYRDREVHCGQAYTAYTCTGNFFDTTDTNYLSCQVSLDAATVSYAATAVDQPNSDYTCYDTTGDYLGYRAVQSTARLCSGAWEAVGQALCYCWDSKNERSCNHPMPYYLVWPQLAMDCVLGHLYLFFWVFSRFIVLLPGRVWEQVVKPLVKLPDFYSMCIVPFIFEVVVGVLLILSTVVLPEEELVPFILGVVFCVVTCAVAVTKLAILTFTLHAFRLRQWVDNQLFVDFVAERYLPFWEMVSVVGNLLPGLGFGVAVVVLDFGSVASFAAIAMAGVAAVRLAALATKAARSCVDKPQRSVADLCCGGFLMTTMMMSRFDVTSPLSPVMPNGTLRTLPRIPLVFRLWDGARAVCKVLAANVWFQLFTTLVTVYALFADDIRMTEFEKSADGVFDVLTLSATAIFAAEILINSFGRPGYFNSFYFWLDLISTGTLVLDVSFVAEPVFASAATVADEAQGLEAEGGGGEGGSMLTKAGSKASRIVRIIRLIRLIRVVKMYKAWMQRKKDEEGELFFANDEDGGSAKTKSGGTAETLEMGDEPQSKVGKKLSERITQKLIMVVLAMLVVLPFFSYDSEAPSSVQYYVDTINRDILYYVTECKSSGASSAASLRLKTRYEERLLELVYSHNPTTSVCDASSSSCVSDLLDKLFLLGYVQTDSADTCSDAANFVISQVDIAAQSATFVSSDFGITTGELATETVEALTGVWSTTACADDATFGSGVTVHTKNLLGSSGTVACPSDLRFDQREMVFPFLRRSSNPLFFVVVDERVSGAWEGRLSMFQTLFVIFILAAGVFSFTADAENLVLRPIEGTLQKMERIRADPVAATTLGEEEYRREVLERKKVAEWDAQPAWQRFLLRLVGQSRPKAQSDAMMETAVLEKTIIKIGSLLVLGFGEAGTGVIAQNMQGAEGGVNVLVPGKKVTGLFGFITIRHFAEITEVLQDKVMLFVNQISEIVHGVVDEYGGATNKNVGHAFFVVWRLKEEHEAENAEEVERLNERLCDLAVVSFIKITAAISRSPLLAEYRAHPGILQRIRDFRVELGFGLHVGPAIEGAVGSEFKIDASYVGPDVSLAARLQRLTITYGCSILMSSAVIGRCSSAVRESARKVDSVAFDKKNLVALFTVDLDPTALDLASPQPHRAGGGRLAARKGSVRRHTTIMLNSQQSKAQDALEVARAGMLRYKLKEERNLRKRIKLEKEYDVGGVFKGHRDILDMRQKFTDATGAQFNALFQKGVLNYEAGEWVVARDALEQCLQLVAGDGPSEALLKFMAKTQFVKPATWRGYRNIG